MDSLNQIKQSLRQLIDDENYRQFIQEVDKLSLTEKGENTFIIIKSHYEQYVSKSLTGFDSYEEETQYLAQNVHRFLGFIEALDKYYDNSEENNQQQSNQTNNSKKSIWWWIGIVGSIASIVSLLIYFLMPPNDTIDLTIHIRDNQGRVILENQGKLTVNFGNDPRKKVIGENGSVHFEEIPAKFKNEFVIVGLDDIVGYEIVGTNKIQVKDKPVTLIVQRDKSWGYIHGEVFNQNGSEALENVKIRIDGHKTIYTDSEGAFEVYITPEKSIKSPEESYKIRATLDGYQPSTANHYSFADPYIEIRLIKE